MCFAPYAYLLDISWLWSNIVQFCILHDFCLCFYHSENRPPCEVRGPSWPWASGPLCRKPRRCMFSLFRRTWAGRLQGAGSVSAELMEGDRVREVRLNKWIARRDAECETWNHFSSGDGVNKTNTPARVEGIYLFKCWQVCRGLCTLPAQELSCCFQANVRKTQFSFQ